MTRCILKVSLLAFQNATTIVNGLIVAAGPLGMAIIRLGPNRWRAFHAGLLREGNRWPSRHRPSSPAAGVAQIRQAAMGVW